MKENALQNIGYGLYLLSAKANGKDNACIINTLMQVTNSNPALCIVNVNKQSLTHDLIIQSKAFNVSVLTKNSLFELIKHFGYQSGHNMDKFVSFKETKRSQNGLLYITENTNSFLSFDVTKIIDFDSHTMFVGKLSESAVLSSVETLTYDYYQTFVKPKSLDMKKQGFRCQICDYFHEGIELPSDFICPICNHGAEVFTFEK